MQQSNQNMENKNNDLTEIITQALNEMKMELGDNFDIDKVNLAELERRTGITRAKLRRIKSNGFIDKPHGLTGRKAEHTVLSGYTAVIDNLLGKSITNASLIHERIGDFHPIQFYYSGKLEEKVAEPIEKDHVLEWLPYEEACDKMFVEAQKWILKKRRM